MGGGGTLVDGIRRFFQRRTDPPPINSQSHVVHDDIDHHNNNNNDNDNNNDGVDESCNANVNSDNLVSVTDQDSDISSLKLLKVPTRSHFKASSMDRHKKVPFFFSLSLLLLLLLLLLFGFVRYSIDLALSDCLFCSLA